MLAGHFAFVYTTGHAWLVLVALMLLGVWVRLFFNLRHAGRTHWWMPAVGALAAVGLAVAIRPDNEAAAPTPGDVSAGRNVFLTAGCVGCHTLADAKSTGTVGPNLDSAKPSADLVRQRVENGLGPMPSFRGRLSPAQIDAVAAYVSSVAGK
jgi:mono/diheme cytochrome c family protein